MSNADFQERLQRIGASPAQQKTGAVASGGSGSGKPNIRMVGMGGALISLGVYTAKYANQNYETLRDADQAGTIAVLGLGAVVSLLLGTILFFRAFKRRSANYVDYQESQRAQAPTAARVLWSLVGFLMGATASMYMFLAAAAKFIDTEMAQQFSAGGIVIALGLFLVSLFIGFVGLFLRGYALGRAPVYFLLGGVITYAAVRIMRINVLEWTEFVRLLQG